MPMPPNMRFTATGRNGANSSRMKSASNDNLRKYVARIERSEIRDRPMNTAKPPPGFAGSQPGLQLDQLRPLFRLDIGGLDDRPPLLDLGALKRLKLLRRLLFARRTVQPDIPEPPADDPVRERAELSCVALRD